MDFYFQDHLRWNLGFENPNKAAAFLATLLPLLWLVYQVTWQVKSRVLRGMAVSCSSLLLLSGWWALIKTYSRGGLIAGLVAFLYIVWKTYRRGRSGSVRRGVSIGLLFVVGMFSFVSGVAHRSTQWISTPEGSVENRLELWKGSLRMISSIPQGVGTGNSGEFYMQWFQPLESAEGYRTLVNSYLTFAAEQGLVVAGVTLFLTLFFWALSRVRQENGKAELLSVVFRACLLGFVVAGFFSTTMEEARLWVLPIISMLVLAGLHWSRKKKICWLAEFAKCLAVTFLALGLLWGIGKALNTYSPVSLTLQGGSEVDAAVIVTPRKEAVGTIWVAVDQKVLGESYGKLLRQLAEEKNLQLIIGSKIASQPSVNSIILVGDQVDTILPKAAETMILIAPSVVDDKMAEDILRHASFVALFLPDFDEDGRSEFWKEQASKATGSAVSVITLEGVGTRVDWIWESIIQKLP